MRLAQLQTSKHQGVVLVISFKTMLKLIYTQLVYRARPVQSNTNCVFFSIIIVNRCLGTTATFRNVRFLASLSGGERHLLYSFL